MCCVKEFNLSYESLTGYDARQRLRNLKITDPEFYETLVTGKIDLDINKGTAVPEDDPEDEVDLPEDDSNLPCKTIIAHVLAKKLPATVLSGKSQGLLSGAQAESFDETPVASASQEQS